MAEKKRLNFTIVNKNYPPNPGITGESANELTYWLIQQGHNVTVIHTDGKYSGGGSTKSPAGKLIAIKSLYNGKKKLIRLVASFIESYRLIIAAKEKGQGLLIVMTDPPFLILWASILLQKRKWAYWSMDLYPEAFVAGKLITKHNFLYKQFKKVVHRHPPDFLIALGQHQLDFLQKGYGTYIKHTTLPCGITRSAKGNVDKLPDWKQDKHKIYIGYCGNLGEAHSANFILTIIELLDPAKYTLVLSVYGSKAQEVLVPAKNKQHIIIKNRIERQELQFIDIHLVTLLPEWNNICVPSKAVSAVCEGGVILFCGDTRNDNWYYLNEAGWKVEEGPNLKENLQQLLQEISQETLLKKKLIAEKLSLKMLSIKEAAFNDIIAEGV